MKMHVLKLAGILAGLASTAFAQLYIATGASTGVVSYFNFSLDPTLNRLSVTIDNTHAGLGGVTGTVTSFGFNVPDSLMASATLLSPTPTGWTLARPYDLNAGGNNFMQDLGAKTGNNVNGGSPQDGIAFGETATFVFQFSDFASATGFLGTDGVSARWQVVTAGGGSDAGFGNPGPARIDVVPVPEPSTYGSIAAAVLLLGALFQRRRNAALSR